jgi:hypothetical protein
MVIGSNVVPSGALSPSARSVPVVGRNRSGDRLPGRG